MHSEAEKNQPILTHNIWIKW